MSAQRSDRSSKRDGGSRWKGGLEVAVDAGVTPRPASEQGPLHGAHGVELSAGLPSSLDHGLQEAGPS